MSKSAIQILNNTSQAFIENGDISLGNIIYRFGPNLGINGNALSIIGAGYYSISVSATILPSEAGQVTLSLYRNGVLIPGASATTNAASTTVPMTITLPSIIVKENYNGGCPCEQIPDSITLVATTGAGTAITVVTQAIKI